jgi:hypothetical protein
MKLWPKQSAVIVNVKIIIAQWLTTVSVWMGFEPKQRQAIFFSPSCPHWLWSPVCILSNGNKTAEVWSLYFMSVYFES